MAINGKNGGGKTGGRRKGVPNATTKKAREIIMSAIDQQSVNFDKTMKKIQKENPTEWAKIMVKLMDFVLPKKIDVTTDGEKINQAPTKITLSNGTEIEL